MALLLAVLLVAGLSSIAAADHNTVELVSTGPIGGAAAFDATFGEVSSDGSKVFFYTREALVSADDDGDLRDVYERSGGGVTLLSTSPTDLADGLQGSLFVDASADGSRVIFESDDSLVPEDADQAFDVYERSGGTTRILSQGPGGGNGSFDIAFAGASNDGTTVFFSTEEPLVGTDTDGNFDLYGRSGSTTTLLTVGAAGDPDNFLNDDVVFPSDDGSRVVVSTDRQWLAGDMDAVQDLYEFSGGGMTQVSVGDVNGNGAAAAAFMDMSSDGKLVFFRTQEQLTSGDTDSCGGVAPVGCADVYVRDLGAAPQTRLISTGPNEPNADYNAFFGGITPDGAKVFFSTNASLVADDADDHREDVYDRNGNTTTLISIGPMTDTGYARFLSVSDDGQRVFFLTDGRLVPEDTGVGRDVYERSGSQTALISTGPTDTGQDDEVDCFIAPTACEFMTSSNGSRVFFQTAAKLTSGDTDSAFDLYERASGQTTLISAGGSGNFPALLQGISQDGGQVFFQTDETLSPSDQDGTYQDLYQARFVQPVVTPPSAGTPPAASSGKPNLTVKLSGRKTQRILRQGGVVVSFICNNDCRASATGSIKVPGASKVFRLGKATKSAKANKKTTLKLKLAKKARSAIKRALRRGKKLRAKVKLTVKDGGSTRTRSLTVRVKR